MAESEDEGLVATIVDEICGEIAAGAANRSEAAE